MARLDEEIETAFYKAFPEADTEQSEWKHYFDLFAAGYKAGNTFNPTVVTEYEESEKALNMKSMDVVKSVEVINEFREHQHVAKITVSFEDGRFFTGQITNRKWNK